MTESAEHHPYQFSLQSLFKSTLIVSVILTVAVLSQNTHFIDAIFPFGMLLAVVPVGIVWGLDRLRLIAPHSLALGSILLYATALCVPALQTDHRAVLLGWVAFVYSFVGISMWGEWGADWARLWSPFFYTIGAATNLAFIVGYVGLLAGFKGANTEELTLKSGRYGTILAVAVLLPLALSGGLTGLYPGYGLWAASLLALWLGSRRLTSEDDT